MIICNNCNTQNNEKDTFCNKCGTKLVAPKKLLLFRNISFAGYAVVSALLLFSLFSRFGLAWFFNILTFSGLKIVAMFGNLIVFTVIAYAAIPFFIIAYRIFASRQKEIMAYHAGKITAFIASFAPLLLMFFGIALVISLLFTATNMNRDFDRALSSLDISPLAINTVIYFAGAIATLVSIPIGIKALFSLPKNKPLIPAQYAFFNKVGNIGTLLIGLLIFALAFTNARSVISPSDTKIVLNYVKGNILLQEMDISNNLKTNFKYSIVYDYERESLYMVEFSGRYTENGEPKQGGAFVIVHIIDGIAHARNIVEYDDFSYNTSSRRDALTKALDLMSSFLE